MTNNREPVTTTAPFARLQTPATPQAPKAKAVPHSRTFHQQTLSDDYFWLKDPDYPKVETPEILDYLKAENQYFRDYLAPHQSLVDTLYQEFKGRESEDNSSVPWTEGEFEYRWYFKPGAEYKTWARRSLAEAAETVILDVAQEAKAAGDKDYFQVRSVMVSPNGRYLAWSVDDSGAERFTIRIRDLHTGDDLPDVIEQTSGTVAWSADSQSLLYVVVSEEWRPYLAKSHALGTETSADHELYREDDTGFFVDIGKSQSGEYFLIGAETGSIAELRVLPATEPAGTPVQVVSREIKADANIDHANGQFYILLNDTHHNFRLVSAPEDNPTQWQELISGSDEVYLTGLCTFKSFMVLKQKSAGLDQIRIRSYDGSEYLVQFPESLYGAYLDKNPEYDQQHVRLSYQSMISPQTVFDYHLADKKLETRKVREIPSGYDKSQYRTERVWVTARDGANVPVSLVYRQDFTRDGSHPMHLYAYGAYAAGMPPAFSAANLSLLDRGFVFAIAHIRGGDEMGYQWYLDGKLDKRTNTFNDFVDVARHLVSENYVSAGNISISGASAGGELMGAVTIQAPELWRSVILGVPFVDVLNTMLDDSLPLTPIEWPEWGNPIESAKDYATILAYSPYDNIEAREYPPMLVTGGLNDPRVTYWEPAKWTAKMRSSKTDNNLLLMRMHMGAGHFSSSGRYAALKDTAEEFAFMLLAHGIED